MTDGYTKRDRKALVKAFREGKKFLWDGKSPRGPWVDNMICFAIALAEHAGAVTPRAGALAANLIQRRLGWGTGMRTWLKDRGVPRGDLTDERVQAHRHAWLDLLIAEFSAP